MKTEGQPRPQTPSTPEPIHMAGYTMDLYVMMHAYLHTHRHKQTRAPALALARTHTRKKKTQNPLLFLPDFNPPSLPPSVTLVPATPDRAPHAHYRRPKRPDTLRMRARFPYLPTPGRGGRRQSRDETLTCKEKEKN